MNTQVTERPMATYVISFDTSSETEPKMEPTRTTTMEIGIDHQPSAAILPLVVWRAASAK